VSVINRMHVVMMTNIKGIELIKGLLSWGYQGVNVQFADPKGSTLKGLITVNNDLWAILDSSH